MQNLKKNFKIFEGNNWKTQKNMTYMGCKIPDQMENHPKFQKMQNLKKNFKIFEGNNWKTQKNMTYMGHKFWEF